jgi:hypothetical protein
MLLDGAASDESEPLAHALTVFPELQRRIGERAVSIEGPAGMAIASQRAGGADGPMGPHAPSMAHRVPLGQLKFASLAAAFCSPGNRDRFGLSAARPGETEVSGDGRKRRQNVLPQL